MPGTLVAAPAPAAPLLRATIGGTAIDKPVAFDIEARNTYDAARFTVSAALSIDSAQTWAWWDAQASAGTPPRVELFAAYATGSAAPAWQSVLLGRADRISVDPIAGMVTIEGRDLFGLLFDTTTQQTWQNQTSSQIWQQLAAGHGLATQITATTTPVWRYFEIDHTLSALIQHHRLRSEATVAIELAKLEGFDIFTTGSTFVAQPQAAPSNPFIVKWTPAVGGGAGGASNAPRVVPWRNLNLSQKVTVKILSYGTKTGNTSAPVSMGGGSRGGSALSYVFTRPNLTQAQAQQLAGVLAQQISRHAAGIDVTLAAPPLGLTPRAGLALQGSGTSWDQTYYIDEQRFSLSMSGATMALRCKNVPPAIASATATSDEGATTSPTTLPATSPTNSVTSTGQALSSTPAGGWYSAPQMANYQSVIAATAPTGMTQDQWANLLGTESSGNPVITNPTSGAMGIAQILPSTAADPGYGLPSISATDAYTPQTAIPWSSNYINALTAQYGSTDAAIQHYSGGGYTLGNLNNP